MFSITMRSREPFIPMANNFGKNPEFPSAADAAIRRARVDPPMRSGKLVRMVGLTLEAQGVVAPAGAICLVESAGSPPLEAEVVGFNASVTYLMPFSEPAGIGPGASVRVVSMAPSVRLGPALLGRVIDARGIPLDGRPAADCQDERSLRGLPLNPLERGSINQILDVGVKAINGVLTIGRGQRIGLMAGSGVGKSVLLGMLTRYTKADVVVIGLIGERGREVNDFIKESLGPEGLARSVVVAAPANVSPVLRLRATNLAHLVAEYFRDKGLSVLLLVDSLTRVAHAQREIGLAVGEPPTAKGYPPSVFALLPNLIERAGVGKGGFGSITAIYTVLMENDDTSDPVVDIARASLDGQVMLSRALADAAHYPAIDLMGSVSRLMQALVDPNTLKAANRFRRLWTLYQQNSELIQVGAYEQGANPDLDEAVAKRAHMENFLRQDMDLNVDYPSAVRSINELMAN